MHCQFTKIKEENSLFTYKCDVCGYTTRPTKMDSADKIHKKCNPTFFQKVRKELKETFLPAQKIHECKKCPKSN